MKFTFKTARARTPIVGQRKTLTPAPAVGPTAADAIRQVVKRQL